MNEKVRPMIPGVEVPVGGTMTGEPERENELLQQIVPVLAEYLSGAYKRAYDRDGGDNAGAAEAAGHAAMEAAAKDIMQTFKVPR